MTKNRNGSRKVPILLIILAFIFSILPAIDRTDTRSILYVDIAATGSNNGSSWANAYTSLQSALAAAEPFNRIWITRC